MSFVCALPCINALTTHIHPWVCRACQQSVWQVHWYDSNSAWANSCIVTGQTTHGMFIHQDQQVLRHLSASSRCRGTQVCAAFWPRCKSCDRKSPNLLSVHRVCVCVCEKHIALYQTPVTILNMWAVNNMLPSLNRQPSRGSVLDLDWEIWVPIPSQAEDHLGPDTLFPSKIPLRLAVKWVAASPSICTLSYLAEG